MHFYDENYGVIGGDNGNFNCKMYQTNDGGLTWSNTQVPFAPNINALYMTDTNSVYIAGDDGSIANFGGIGGITTTINEATIFENNQINIYPNPASTQITIELLSPAKNTSIEIIDMQGKIVLSKNTNSHKTAINIEQLSKGFYFVRINNSNQTQIEKFIKQ